MPVTKTFRASGYYEDFEEFGDPDYFSETKGAEETRLEETLKTPVATAATVKKERAFFFWKKRKYFPKRKKRGIL